MYKFIPLLEQLLNLLSVLQLNHLWPQLKCSALTTSSAPIWCMSFVISLRYKLNTRKVSSSKTPAPRCFDTVAGWRGYLACCSLVLSSLPLSLPVSHFCRMFLLSWVPIVHTLSWLASQGCCWLLVPLIGSSCALAFLARLGLACAWSSLLHKAFLGGICVEKTVRENEMKNSFGKWKGPHWQI